MEGGEWNSFNGVYVNEEADFMAQMFPTNGSVPTSDEVDGHSSLACWSNSFNMATGSAYPSSDAANPNLNCCFSQENGYSGGSGIASYHIAGHENYYACDNSSLFEFLDEKVEAEKNCLGPKEEELRNKHFLPKTGSVMSLELEDETSNCSDISRKRARISDVRKGGRRNATRSKKKQKAGVVEEDNSADLNKQTTSGCSSEDESNLSLELNNGASSTGKTRASRGSATDPQSLYARKRRERINERLKVLQSLVPNGTKVDMSTMLEEAVLYVKFLQVQIKLLSSDDLWMYAPIAYNGMDIGLNLKR